MRVSQSLSRARPTRNEQQLTKPTEGSTDEELANVDLLYVLSTYGYPHMVGHRSSLANALLAGCKREKSINLFMATAIDSVTSWGPNPSFTALPRKGGERYPVTCDILLAADGVKSVIRDQMLKENDIDAKIIDSGQAAYRIMLTREQMGDDQELLALLDQERATRWIGEKRHIIAYPVSNKTIYNLSTAQPDLNFADAPSTTYTTRGSKPQMMDVYSDFCPMVKRMLDLVPDGEVCEWKLRVHDPLPFWSYHQTSLIGDAAHPTLPHMAQGAAQAIEDGGVLGIVLSQLPDASPKAVEKGLKVYEKLRRDRAYALVEMAAATGRSMHLGEGADKEERDRQFAKLRAGGGGKVPDNWADAEVQKIVYGTDVMEIAREEFGGMYGSV